MAPVAFYDAIDDFALRALARLHVLVEVPELLDGGQRGVEIGGVVIIIVVLMAAEVGRTDGDIVVVEPVKHDCQEGLPVQTVEVLRDR